MRDSSRAADGFLRPGLKIIGGKQGFTKNSGRSLIYSMLPPIPTDQRPGIRTYIEPFLGSGAVLIGKQPHPHEWAGDLQPYVINFFNTMKKQPEELWQRLQDLFRLIENTPSTSGELFWSIRDQQPEPTGIKGAVWFYFVNKYCTNGILRFNSSGKCNSSWCKTYKGRGIYTRAWYDSVFNRIKNVQFECKPYEYSFALANEPNGNWSPIVVCDPPYFDVFASYDKIKFSNQDHIKLAGELSRANFLWLLTINDCLEIRELYQGFNIREVQINYCCSNTNKGRGPKPELFITNY